MNRHKKTRTFSSLAASEVQVLVSSCDDNHSDRITRLGNLKQRSKDQEQFLFHISDVSEVYQAELSNKPSKSETSLALRYANRLMGCGNYLLFKNYYSIGETKLAKVHSCQVHLLCPFCAAVRASKSSQRYQERVEHVLAQNKRLKPVFITLTVKNGADLSERMSHLKNAFKTLVERRRDSLKKKRGYVEFSKLDGAVFSYELTRNEKTKEWHPHLHMFALANEWIDRDALINEWQSITGDSHIVDVRRVKKDKELGYGKAFAEVFKYSLKFSDLSLGDTWEGFKGLRGQRLTGAIGSLYGVKIPEGAEDEQLNRDDLPYLELLYRFKNNAGYDLAHTRHVEAQNTGTTENGTHGARGTQERVPTAHGVPLARSDASPKLIDDDDEATRTEEERSKDVANDLTNKALERLSEHIASYGERSTSRMILALMPDLELDVFDSLALERDAVEAASSDPD
jgi:plasmid rolling circle replication initiator protein Rep